MHGGLPFIGVSVLVYGVVGAVVIARAALRRRGRARPAFGDGAARAGGAGGPGGAVTGQGVRSWPAVSR